MNSTGQHGEKASYRIILLLVVGLTAFSSAMKELNQLQQFGLEASRLAAEWSGKLIPAEVPPTAPVITVENSPLTCENKELQQSAPSVELPWLDNDAAPHAPIPERIKIRKAPPAPPALEQPSRLTESQIAKLRQLRRLEIDPVEFEVRILSDHDAEADAPVAPELPLYTFKAKSRKHNPVRTPREREIILKSVNRSINLRIAG
jgi:hypothetical protein